MRPGPVIKESDSDQHGSDATASDAPPSKRKTREPLISDAALSAAEDARSYNRTLARRPVVDWLWRLLLLIAAAVVVVMRWCLPDKRQP